MRQIIKYYLQNLLLQPMVHGGKIVSFHFTLLSLTCFSIHDLDILSSVKRLCLVAELEEKTIVICSVLFYTKCQQTCTRNQLYQYQSKCTSHKFGGMNTRLKKYKFFHIGRTLIWLKYKKLNTQLLYIGGILICLKKKISQYSQHYISVKYVIYRI